MGSIQGPCSDVVLQRQEDITNIIRPDFSIISIGAVFYLAAEHNGVGNGPQRPAPSTGLSSLFARKGKPTFTTKDTPN